MGPAHRGIQRRHAIRRSKNVTQEARPVTDRMKGRDWLMTQDWSDEEIELALEEDDTLLPPEKEQQFRKDARQLDLDTAERVMR